MAKEKEITIETLLEAKDPAKLLQELPFEQSLHLLETLVAAVERGALPLERSIQSYEKGALIVEHLRETLTKAEARLATLKRGKGGEIVES